ncbi:Arp1p [Saccharomyces cerevisiae P283]|nr:Arp1p [Saccharomyces cerevisiae P283]
MDQLSDSYALYNQPVLIDNGSGIIKAGFSGEERPKALEYCLVGNTKYDKVMLEGLQGDTFIGNNAQKLRGLLKLRYPIKHGVVEDWDSMELIWSYVLNEVLQLQNIGEHPLLITEAPMNPLKNREQMAQVLFETFDVSALYVSNPAVLSLYASGRTTGCVVDCGEGYCSTVPIYDGFALPASMMRMDIGGADITEQLQFQLRKSAGVSLFSSSEREIVRTMKEKVCYLAKNIKKEEEKYLQGTQDLISTFKLPDGRCIEVGNDRYRAPEILFSPQIIGLGYDGLSDMCMQSIWKVDLDLRKPLLSSIILSGGTTTLKGFGDRMLWDLEALTKGTSKIKIIAPSERKYTTWIGGSILTGLSTFQRLWTKKSDWLEDSTRVYSNLM